jgi:hypothetical protein
MNDSELEQLWYSTKFTPQLIKQLITLNPDYVFLVPKELVTSDVLISALKDKPEFETDEARWTIGDISGYFQDGDPESGIQQYFPHLKNDQNVINAFKTHLNLKEHLSRIKKLSGIK